MLAGRVFFDRNFTFDSVIMDFCSFCSNKHWKNGAESLNFASARGLLWRHSSWHVLLLEYLFHANLSLALCPFGFISFEGKSAKVKLQTPSWSRWTQSCRHDWPMSCSDWIDRCTTRIAEWCDRTSLSWNMT
jgi:hypothetical protein